MSNVLPQIWTVLTAIWEQFFVGWKIPLLNFTPATMIFGVLSFFVAIKFMKGILTISAEGGSTLADDFRANREKSKYLRHKRGE